MFSSGVHTICLYDQAQSFTPFINIIIIIMGGDNFYYSVVICLM